MSTSPPTSSGVASVSGSELPSLMPLDGTYEAAHEFSTYANWLIPGRLMLGRYPFIEPSRRLTREQGEQQLAQILTAGVTTFISLQAELPEQSQIPAGGVGGFLAYRPVADLILSSMHGPPPMESLNALRNPYLNKFLPEPRVKGAPRPAELMYARYPIVDLGLPDQRKLMPLLADLRQRLADGQVVYLHCWAGRGRAGTVGACLLVDSFGVDAEEALQRVLRAYTTRENNGSCSPETPEQLAFVRGYADMKKSLA